MVSTEYLCIVCCDRTNYKFVFCQRLCYTYAKYQIQQGYVVKRHTRSLLEELNDIAVRKDAESVIESRAQHIIDSAINLLHLIRENFDPEQAYELERRFLNSIKGADPAKFTRGIRKFRDAKVPSTLKSIEESAKPEDDSV